MSLRPRRSVVIGALTSVIVGGVLAATALPALADSLIVTPSTSLVTRSVTTTTPTTTTTVARHHASARRDARVAHLGARLEAPRRSTARSSSDTTPTTTPTTVPVTTPPTTAPSTVPVPNVALKLGSNIAPNPDFLASGTGSLVNGAVQYQNPCVQNASWPHFTNDPGCTNYVLQAINNARAIEGVKPMVLPSNWYSLSTAQQLFVVADLERVDRGLPPYLGLNADLTSAAQHAAATRSDPAVAAGFPIGTDAQGSPAFGGAWAGGFNVLVADYVWMYDDGWGGANNTSNVACTSPGAAGCWAHREELLGYDPGYNPAVGLGCATCEMGTGFALVGGTSASFVDLIEMPKPGSVPAMTFTWAEEQQYL